MIETTCIVHRIPLQLVCDEMRCGLCYEASLKTLAAYIREVRETEQLDDEQE